MRLTPLHYNVYRRLMNNRHRPVHKNDRNAQIIFDLIASGYLTKDKFETYFTVFPTDQKLPRLVRGKKLEALYTESTEIIQIEENTTFFKGGAEFRPEDSFVFINDIKAPVYCNGKYIFYVFTYENRAYYGARFNEKPHFYTDLNWLRKEKIRRILNENEV